MKYSIIIPVFNQEKLTNACLESIKKNTSDYEIIIIDNGSQPVFIKPNYCIRNATNLGFPIAINQGIKKAQGDIIILLNNDTVVSQHWAERLTEHLKDYDMVGPLTNNISGVQQITIGAIELPEKLDEVAEKIYSTNTGHSNPYHRLVFFCVAIKREVINKIGLLDEQFTPGNCEDDDYCLRAIEAGFKLGIAEDTFIYHKGSASKDSYGIEYSELLKKNILKLQTKWPHEKYNAIVQKNKENCANIQKKKKRTIALVMIVKNEELGLERAILSAKDIVDEIHIAIDYSTSDNSLEIAKKYTKNITFFTWNDDFAEARNFAHKEIKTDWILFLDGHEYITKHTNLEFMLTSPADALLCSVELENGSMIRNPRIYKNGLKFEGKIHEIQNYKTISVYPDFVVKHGRADGQSKDAIKIREIQTNDMIPRIMGKQLEDDPTNTRASFHLALFYQTRGDYKTALKIQKKYFKYAKIKGERWLMYFNKSLIHFALKNTLRALWATDDAEKETPRRWEISKLRGLIFYKDKQYKKAIDFLVESFDENKGDVTYKPWIRNNAETWNIIGECYFNLGRLDIASEAFNEAFKNETDGKKKKFFYDRAKLMNEMSCQN